MRNAGCTTAIGRRCHRKLGMDPSRCALPGEEVTLALEMVVRRDHGAAGDLQQHQLVQRNCMKLALGIYQLEVHTRQHV